MPTAVSSNGLAGLEIVRFAAAFSVVVFHYNDAFSGDPRHALKADLLPQLPIYPVLRPFYEHGEWAVHVFWALSGFIFFREYAQSIAARRVDFVTFSGRRFARLYPLHLVTLLLMAALHTIYLSSHTETFVARAAPSAEGFLSHLAFASAWFAWQPSSFNCPIWSVSVEVLIYASFFVIVRFVGSSCLVVLGPGAVFFTLFVIGATWGLPFSVSPMVMACGAFFFAGGLVCRLVDRPESVPIATVTAMSILAFLIVGGRGPDAVSMLFLAPAIIMVGARAESLFPRVALARVAFLGQATYSSYLLHMPILLASVIVVDRLGMSRDVFLSPFMFIGYLAVVLIASFAVYRWFEKPARDAINGRLAGFRARSKLAPA